MAESPTEIEASMMLCDHAQSVGGKLFVMGGGWTQVRASQWSGTMALAITIGVPWDHTNEPIRLRAALLTEDGDSAKAEGGRPIEAQGNIEVGRPPGIRRGAPLGTTMALNFQGLNLPLGGYVWVLEMDGEIRDRRPFQVVT